MPGVLTKLPACFDTGFFFNCSGVVERKTTAGFFPFIGLMSTLGSALIKSCRNIFTTVQRKWGYLVKLVSLHSEDLWEEAEQETFARKELFLDSASPYIRAQVACELSLFISTFGEIFPHPPGRGRAVKVQSPVDLVSCVRAASPCLISMSEYIKFRKVDWLSSRCNREAAHRKQYQQSPRGPFKEVN